ncbi:molecular chaperone DnaJ [Mesorhizobium sp. BAC0120]|uniref:molecular chaperone DnaJ n=1 Tax=Mesorhizobium sp. BAC0120 TaxID=3090670 RepID=UPI00298CE728|nr:molecular chaperone DnaJ [Mesorhizobium sp. BAC0120]MDW6022802.1 molecular chaperone DnaJ [Mesorhizobium sp. BAC0120]
MSIILEILVGLLAAALLAVAFLRASPTALASAIRIVGPMLLGFMGLSLVAVGRAGLGSILITAALFWIAITQLPRNRTKPKSQRSMVRTAALEMELDHETGALEGLVLAGRREGRLLSRLSQSELVELYKELAGDFESRQLLEAYLDSRFPIWRKNAQPNFGDGLGGPPSSGPMTKEEAYKVLGLEAGAAAADVREAHRRLMQRLHPDVGGSSFLAARINKAKDVLLSDHN